METSCIHSITILDNDCSGDNKNRNEKLIKSKDLYSIVVVSNHCSNLNRPLLRLELFSEVAQNDMLARSILFASTCGYIFASYQGSA